MPYENREFVNNEHTRKTELITIFFPAWILIHKRNLRLATVTYAQNLAEQLNDDRRRLIKSNWYQNNWGASVTIEGTDNKTAYATKQGAFFFATSVGGQITGLGFDIIIGDDMQKPMDMESPAKRKDAVDYYSGTLQSRFNNPKRKYFINVQQRLHYYDISGWIERNEKNAKGEHIFDIINLPMEATKFEQWRCPFTNRVLFERDQGDLLWPSRWGTAEVDDLKRHREMYNSQYQQNPLKEQGEELNLNDLIRYDRGDIPDSQNWKFILSVDANLKDNKSADPVGIVLGLTNYVDTYVIEVDNRERGLNGALRKIRTFYRKYPIDLMLIEDKANGPAIIQTLKNEIPGILPITPFGSKRARFEASKPFIQSHNVFIPGYEDGTWLMDNWVHYFLQELSEFPAGDHDDMVDAFSQLINYIYMQKKEIDAQEPAKWVMGR